MGSLHLGSAEHLAEARSERCFLDALPAPAQRSLLGAARTARYSRGDVVTEQGSPVVGVSCVRRGVLRCWQTDVDGRDYAVETAWRCSVSVVGLRGPAGRWPWNATAVTPALVLTFPWEALEQVRRSYPVDRAIMEYAAADYIQRQVWTGMLRSVKLRQRLLMLLRRLADELGTAAEGGTMLDFPLPQSELAALAYVSREEISRVMREFADQGLVKPIGRRGLLIPNPDKLHPPIELP
jgi:CRP/FNR family cyclic AMP-dependent transcriptional regulator